MAHLIEPPGREGQITDDEQRVLDALVRELPDNYLVLPVIQTGEIGHRLWMLEILVIAPHAVYAVAVNDRPDQIEGEWSDWWVDGRRQRAPTLRILGKAKVVKSRLVAYARVLDAVWVEGVVVLAGPPTALAPADPIGVEQRLDHLIDVITDPSKADQRPFAVQEHNRLVVRRRVFEPSQLIDFITDPGSVGQRPFAIQDMRGLVLDALTEAFTLPRDAAPPATQDLPVRHSSNDRNRHQRGRLPRSPRAGGRRPGTAG